jgi:hypothetical protein
MPTAGYRPRSPSTNSLQTCNDKFPPSTSDALTKGNTNAHRYIGLWADGDAACPRRHDVDFSYSRSPAKLNSSPATRAAEALRRPQRPSRMRCRAAGGPLVALDDVLGQAGDRKGKTVVSCSVPGMPTIPISSSAQLIRCGGTAAPSWRPRGLAFNTVPVCFSASSQRPQKHRPHLAAATTQLGSTWP